jgi:hypothetical protein
MVIRIRKSKKNSQHNRQKKKRTKGQTTIYKTSQRKLKNEQQEPHETVGNVMCSGSDTCLADM